MSSNKAVALVSGGIDSITLAYLLTSEGFDLHLLSVDYGQRHLKELEYAELCAQRLDAKIDVADVSRIGKLLKGSALTDDIPVPHGHYAAPNMTITVVPNRNAIMLSIAYGLAVAEGAEIVATGVHTGDHFIYPDCRPEFIKAFDEMQKKAVEGFGDESLRLYAPFVERSKADIVATGARLGVPYADTWSCYEGGEVHCGLCATCGERRASFVEASLDDPTVYRVEPEETWRVMGEEPVMKGKRF